MSNDLKSRTNNKNYGNICNISYFVNTIITFLKGKLMEF